MLSTSNALNRLQCDHPGCKRSYLRNEHLNRHRLTHQNGAFQCCLCTKHFTRNDLLRAHLKRHEKRPHKEGRINHDDAAIVRSSGIDGPTFGDAEGHNVGISDTAIAPLSSRQDVLNGSASLNLLADASAWPETFPPPSHMDLQSLDFHWPFQDGGIFGLQNIDYLNTSAIDYVDPLRDDYSLDHSHESVENSQLIQQTNFTPDDLQTESGGDVELRVATERFQGILSDHPDLQIEPFGDTTVWLHSFEKGLDYADVCMPYFHRPTASLSTLPSLLILALCCVGSMVGDSTHTRELGRKLHKHIRSHLFPTILESPRVDVSTLQTLVLVEHIGFYALSRSDHETADVYHSMIVTISRRSSVLAKSFDGSNTRDSLQKKWIDWIERETVTRLAYTIFIHDVDYSLHFMHPMILAPGLLKLPLPCASDLWTAKTPEEWDRLNEKMRQPPRGAHMRSLESSLEVLLDPSQHRRRGVLQSFSQSPLTMQILIHGLASVVYQHKFRSISQRINVGIHSLETKNIQAGLDCWYENFTTMKIDHSFTEIARSALLTYHFVSILLRESLSDMQMAAGMAFSWGRAVTPQRAQEAFLPLVTTHPVGEEAYRHGLKVIGLCLDEDRSRNFGSVQSSNDSREETYQSNHGRKPLYLTYAAFIAVLVLWAHAIGLSRANTSLTNSRPQTSIWKIEGGILKRTEVTSDLTDTVERPSGSLNDEEGYDSEDDEDLVNIIQQGFSHTRREFDQVDLIKADVRRLMRIVQRRLENSPWEISQEAERVLEGLLNKNGFMD